MKPEVKKKWIAVLRSGEYKQRIGCLHQNNAFCCLGVLCDLHSNEKGNKWKRKWGKNSLYYYNSSEVLPREVVEWAGLLNENPCVESVSLASYNDNDYTFEQIADLIEKGL